MRYNLLDARLVLDILAKLRLIDPQGRMVKELRLVTGTSVIDVRPFASGAYVAEVRGDDGSLLPRSTVVLE